MFRYCLEGFSPNGWRHNDSRVVIQAVGARPESIDRGSKNNSIKTDSISREINEAMDIQSSINGMRKKCKTTAEVANVVVTSKEEGNSGGLEQRCKRRLDLPRPIITTMASLASPSTSSPLVPLVSLPITVDEDPPLAAPYVPFFYVCY
ncbi:hypothetical protein J1N35_029205 [Gossypium stocksii]|uniref:Uncharacterized protein n=1 Tax=Gossypium stocksii TaxID=47602 RepID=A0A9D3UXH5_9ROSI|nr:hypothetical protein J1N35_029205 [Gossypium stocksii]